MAEIIVAPARGHLVPASEMDLELVEALTKGNYVAKLWKPRSLDHLRWYRGLLRLVAENTDWNPDQLHLKLKTTTGFVDDMLINADGSVTFAVKSVAYEKCDEFEFTMFARAALDVIQRDIIPGINRRALKNRIAEYCGVDYNPDEP